MTPWPTDTTVTGIDNVGCPTCKGPLHLVTPFKPTPHEARMVLRCERRHRWLMMVRLTEMVGAAGTMGPRS